MTKEIERYQRIRDDVRATCERSRQLRFEVWIVRAFRTTVHHFLHFEHSGQASDAQRHIYETARLLQERLHLDEQDRLASSLTTAGE